MDRLSNLPEAIIHHIFSFLPANYMFCLSGVSKRFSQLCLSSPYLYFNVVSGIYCSSLHTNFDKYLTQNRTINSFHLTKLYCEGDLLNIPLYLQQRASECNFREISLAFKRFYTYRGQPVPTSLSLLFTFQSLRVLCLQIETHDFIDQCEDVVFPCVVLGSLRSLTLKSINFGGEMSFCEWMSTYAPNLRKLELDSVEKSRPWDGIHKSVVLPPCVAALASLRSLKLKSIIVDSQISLTEWISTFAPNIMKLELHSVVNLSGHSKEGMELELDSVVDLSGHSEEGKIFGLPCIGLSLLESMTLKSVSYDGQISFGKWISTYASNIRKLELESVVNISQKSEQGKIFGITQKSSVIFARMGLNLLESLKLKSIYFDGEIPLGEWISTYAPGIRKLELDSLRNLSTLSSSPLPCAVLMSLGWLKLKSLTFDDHFGKLVSTYAPNLMKLELESVVDLPENSKQGFEITNDSVQVLEVWEKQAVTVRVSAPKLQVLDFEGTNIPHINLSDTKSLNYACIYIQRPRKASNSDLDGVVKIMSVAKFLRISAILIKGLFLRNCRPISIQNIKHVELADKDCTDVHVLSNFISIVPNLATLAIGQWSDLLKPTKSTDNVVLNSYTEVKVDHRQEKEAIIYWTGSDDLKFLRYFLQEMNGLTKMTIVCSSHYHSNKISSFLKEQTEVVSAKVPVHFQLTKLIRF